MAVFLDLGTLLIHLGMDTSQYKRQMKDVERRMKRASATATKLGRELSLKVTLPIVAMGAASVKAFASFDDAMTKSLAIMQDITPQLRREMESVATVISNQGVTSATDLAKSYFFLASAGLDARQSIAALGAVERFAVAGAFDMAKATDLVTDAQSALGLTVKDAQQNLKNMTRVTDVLIGANTLANASAQQFSEALMRAGPAMKAYGINLEEGVAVLAAFADQGKKAAEGGELFGRMLRLMIKGFIDNRTSWDKFSISIEDATGNLRPMADIVKDLTGLLENMGTIQKARTLDMLGFQARSQQAILPLLGLGEAIELYNEKLLLMKGITQEVTDKQLKSFSSQMKITWNQIVNAARAIGDRLSPHILKLNEHIREAVAWWNELTDSSKKLVFTMVLLAASVGPVLLLFGTLLKTIILLKVASFAAAGSVLTLASAFTALYGVIAGFALGTFLFGEFKIVRTIGLAVIKSMEMAWINLTGLFRSTIIQVQIAWTKVVNQIKKEALELRKILPSRLGGISGVEAERATMDLVLASTMKLLDVEEALLRSERQRTEQIKELDRAYKELNDQFDIQFADGAGGKKPIIDPAIAARIKEIEEAIDDATKDAKNAGNELKTWGDEFIRLGEVMDAWEADARDVAGNIGNAFAEAFDRASEELASFVVEGKANFADFAKSVLKDLAAIIIRAAIIRPIVNALGLGTSVPASGGGIQANAQGGIFPGHFEAFANGGITTRPTLGLIGEGGPEAVVPLSGGRNIPVELRGNKQQAPPTIIINNNTGQEIKQDGAPTFDGRAWIVNTIIDDINRHGKTRQAITSLRR